MNTIIKTNENGGIYLPPEILGKATGHQEFSFETEGDAIVLRPVPSSKAAWETRTPEERAEEFRLWAESNDTEANLPDEALRRENIYD